MKYNDILQWTISNSGLSKKIVLLPSKINYLAILLFYREPVLEYNNLNWLVSIVINTAGLYVAFNMHSFDINKTFLATKRMLMFLR